MHVQDAQDRRAQRHEHEGSVSTPTRSSKGDDPKRKKDATTRGTKARAYCHAARRETIPSRKKHRNVRVRNHVLLRGWASPPGVDDGKALVSSPPTSYPCSLYPELSTVNQTGCSEPLRHTTRSTESLHTARSTESLHTFVLQNSQHRVAAQGARLLPTK